MRERYVTESGSTYIVDTGNNTIMREPGLEAGELAHDNEPFEYHALARSQYTGGLVAIWFTDEGAPKMRTTTKVISVEVMDVPSSPD